MPAIVLAAHTHLAAERPVHILAEAAHHPHRRHHHNDKQAQREQAPHQLSKPVFNQHNSRMKGCRMNGIPSFYQQKLAIADENIIINREHHKKIVIRFDEIFSNYIWYANKNVVPLAIKHQ